MKQVNITNHKVTIKDLQANKKATIEDIVAYYNKDDIMLNVEELETGGNVGEKFVIIVGIAEDGTPLNINSDLTSAFIHDTMYDYIEYNGSTPNYMDFSIVKLPQGETDGEMWVNHIFKPLAFELVEGNSTIALRADDHETVAQVLAFMRYNAYTEMMSEIGIVRAEFDTKIEEKRKARKAAKAEKGTAKKATTAKNKPTTTKNMPTTARKATTAKKAKAEKEETVADA